MNSITRVSAPIVCLTIIFGHSIEKSNELFFFYR
jgi:hypothetical protein